jgi:hypothetical protein
MKPRVLQTRWRITIEVNEVAHRSWHERPFPLRPSTSTRNGWRGLRKLVSGGALRQQNMYNATDFRSFCVDAISSIRVISCIYTLTKIVAQLYQVDVVGRTHCPVFSPQSPLLSRSSSSPELGCSGRVRIGREVSLIQTKTLKSLSHTWRSRNGVFRSSLEIGEPQTCPDHTSSPRGAGVQVSRKSKIQTVAPDLAPDNCLY